MKQLFKATFRTSIILLILPFSVFAQSQVPLSTPSVRPNLPMNIPPPPSFGSMTNKNGKFQIISAEYYSEDKKPFLYKRLVKIDTTTGEAWVLFSKVGPEGEVRKWIPLETKWFETDLKFWTLRFSWNSIQTIFSVVETSILSHSLFVQVFCFLK